MRKVIYIACVNLLSVNLGQQSLIIILMLSLFQVFEIFTKPYINNEHNKFAQTSMLILIFSYFLKLFSYSLNEDAFDTITTILLIIINCAFYTGTVFKIISVNVRKYAKTLGTMMKCMIFLFKFFEILIKTFSIIFKNSNKEIWN